MIRPTKRFLWALWMLVLLAALQVLWPSLLLAWFVVGGLLVILGLVDFFFARKTPALVFDRRLPSRFALGEEDYVDITVANRGKRPLPLEIFDGVPENADARELPWAGKVDPGKKVKVSYPTRLLQRGDEVFTAAQVLVGSPLGLWKRRIELGGETAVKVYPNYEPLVEYSLLATEQRIEQMGIIRKNRAGLSKEFHQLRDYNQGDSLNQIDWKSSARRQELISRDYQEQRDQTIILAIDSGSRMRSMDGELSHFDHCLNSMLLLGYIALRQSDKVGVIKFGGQERWLPPVKGTHQMPVLLNHLYDYDVTPQPSDFRAAAERILINQKRRSMVVILTNLRGEDGDDLVQSLRQLRQRHVVVLASLREESVTALSSVEEIVHLGDALGVAAARLYAEERANVLAKLRNEGIYTIDTTATELPIALSNAYLDIKSTI